jgi:hypothetical protein
MNGRGLPGYRGEFHGVLKMPTGLPRVASFMGPGTALVERTRRGDDGLTPVDKTANVHDIEYTLAKNVGDIRKADVRMIKNVDRISKNKSDAKINIAQARLINAKVGLEDRGLMSKTLFADFEGNENIQLSDKDAMRKKLKKLTQEGYGDKTVLPGDTLKLKILKQIAKENKKNSGDQLVGKGYNMPGGGDRKVLSFLLKKIMPDIVSSLDMKKQFSKVPKDKLKSLISKSLSMKGSGKLKGTMKNITNTIFPVLLEMCKGTKVTDKKNVKKMLLTAITNTFKQYINGRATKGGGNEIYSNMSGTGFFSDFARGFRKGFVGTLNAVAPVVSVVAPELAPALAIGNVIDKAIPDF